MRLFVSYLVLALTNGVLGEFQFLNSTDYHEVERRVLRSKKVISGLNKMKPPIMPGKSKLWKTCCGDDLEAKANPEYNYVWPMETVERIYFFIHGLRMLLGSAEKIFKITEPLINDNKLALLGVPISSFMTFDGYPGIITPFDEWRKISQQDSKNGKNVWIIDLYELKEDENPPCEIEHKNQFCYMMRPGSSENRFIISFPKFSSIGVDGWNKIFTLIRTSDWAVQNGITDTTIITTGIYFLWYHPLFNGKFIETSQRDFEPIKLSDYMTKAAKYFTSKINGEIDVAIAWRIQRQFSTSLKNTVQSDLDANPDKGGFVVGCQLGHIMKTIRRRESDASPALLIFDIFANGGSGADQKVGPTRVVRRQIVRAFKAYFKNVVVVEAILRKMSVSEVTQNMDPLKVYANDPETFIVWLEVALGTQVDKLVNAGGHFADAIAAFRGGKGVLEILHPEFCNPAIVNWETGETIENDDLATALFGGQ